MKPISQRIVDALAKLGPMTFDELMTGTVEACWKERDASLISLKRSLDGLMQSNVIELNGRRFQLKA
jgi:hypothetical protein